MSKINLDDRTKLFCKEYIKDFNAGKAWMRAGYEASPENARKSAHRKLQDPEVQKYIKSLINKRSKKLDITVNQVLALYWRMANADMGDFGEWAEGDPNLLKSKIYSSDCVDTSLIQEIGQTKEGFKLKLVDKKSALDAVAKHLGMFIDRHDITSNGKDITSVTVNIVTERKKDESQDERNSGS